MNGAAARAGVSVAGDPPAPAANTFRRSRDAPTLRRPAPRADARRTRSSRTRLRDGAWARGRRPPGTDRRVRRPGGAQHQGQARGVRGRRPVGAGDPRRGRHQHDRHRCRRRPRSLRLQRARPQRCRGGRADHGPSAGDRPADRRQRGRPPQRPLGQAALQQGQGSAGSTMGIIGLGSIGFAVAERAAAFGIHLQSLAKPGRSAHVVSRAEELGITMCDSMRGAGVLLRHRDAPRPFQRRHPAPRRRRASSTR